MNGKITITLEPFGKRVQVEPGTTVLEVARQAGVAVSAVCNGQGTCGACKFSYTGSIPRSLNNNQATLSSKPPVEYHLACQTKVTQDCGVYFPPESLATTQRLQLETNGSGEAVKTDFHVVRDQTKKHAQLHQGKTLIPEWREGKAALGLAVDIGTTKIAAYLVDLLSGETLASEGIINPQVAYGEDVISRIAYANEHPNGYRLLHDCLMGSINELVNQMCEKSHQTKHDILSAVLVGNTLMQHLVLGYPVRQLGEAPYQPYSCDPARVNAQEIGLDISTSGIVYLPPNIAGFVGGDHYAMLVASLPENHTGTILALDIGTNTEISLITPDRHLTCSCASGPAFEGSRIQDGMRASPGAIERVFLDCESVTVQTIDDQPALGICGSGILDAVAELHRTGKIDEAGKFLNQGTNKRFDAFLLVPADRSGNGKGISVSRKDINEIQLAKAAIRSGINILLKEAGIPVEQIDQVILAGAFGTYINPENAIRIGLLPAVNVEKIKQVGNAAGAGARQLLLSQHKNELGMAMRSRIETVELMTNADYMDEFIDAIRFPSEGNLGSVVPL